jgi:hypothetical protein
VAAVLPVQCARLRAAFQAGGSELFYVDLYGGFAVFAGGGRLLQVLGDGCETNGFTGQPSDAL